MDIHDFDPGHLPPDLLQALGLVIMSANHLEATARNTLAEMLGLHPRVAAVAFARLGPAAVFETIADLALDPAQPAPEMIELAAAARRAKAAYDMRNGRAHSVIFLHGSSGESLAHGQKVKVGKDGEFRRALAEDLLDEASAISDAEQALMRCAFRLVGARRNAGL